MGIHIEGQTHEEVRNIRENEAIQEKIGSVSTRVSDKLDVLKGNLIGLEPALKATHEMIENNLESQVNLDDIHDYNKKSRQNVNKKIKNLESKLDEQDKKLDKIMELLKKI